MLCMVSKYKLLPVTLTSKPSQDLKGKTVSIGAANSGVYFNAVDILGPLTT